MITRLDGDQLTASITHLINNYNPHRIGYTELASALAEFLMPITHDGIHVEHLKTVLQLAEDWRDADEESRSTWAQAEESTGAYQRAAARAHQKLRVACMAIADGGTP